MEFIPASSIQTFASAGIESRQLLFPENSSSSRVTITQVTLAQGGTNSRHRHATSEQVWVALQGGGMLLLGDGATRSFAAGDIVRFEDGEVHGLHNTGAEPFIYLSVTSPPLNFRAAYTRTPENDS
jgi:quercetin dioxygenase-like cupin family protein